RARENLDLDAGDVVFPFEPLEFSIVEARDLDRTVRAPLRDLLLALGPFLDLASHGDDVEAGGDPVDEVELRRVGEDAEIGIPALAGRDHIALAPDVVQHLVALVGEPEPDGRI